MHNSAWKFNNSMIPENIYTPTLLSIMALPDKQKIQNFTQGICTILNNRYLYFLDIISEIVMGYVK